MSKKTIILDTDIDTDCDDTGALGILHNLAAAGECTIHGVVCSLPIPECVSTVRAIHDWYGAGNVPVALVDVPDYETSPRWKRYRFHRKLFRSGVMRIYPYHDAVAHSYESRRGKAVDSVPDADATTLYRRLLTEADDGEITICAIGTLTALCQLLQTGPDDISSHSGEELVGRKVAELVTMAVAHYPSGKDPFNWRMDLQAAASVLRRWPGPVIVSAHGDTILTGSQTMNSTSEDHPVRIAYQTYLGDLGKNRPSWDLLAAAYAVRGSDAPFALSDEHALEIDPTSGKHRWGPHELGPPRGWTTPTVSDAEMAEYLEALLIG